MSVDRRPRDYSMKPAQRSRWLQAPAWLVRLRLRWINADIDRLERQLAAEFATLDTAPLGAELQVLSERRDTLLRQLTQRS